MSKLGTRIRGLDSIRFVCALWVLLRHVQPPPLPEVLLNHPGRFAVRGLIGNAFNGQAAVIVFFVISGFCIHFPYRRSSQPPKYASFLTRRYVRIGLPLLAAWAINLALLPENRSFDLFAPTGTIVWSLLAEIIYYTLYPLISRAARRIGWGRLIAWAYVCALGVMLTQPDSLYFSSYGPGLTWIIGLPCWLLGCCLADLADGDVGRAISAPRIWLWRGGIWLASVASSALMFHSSIGFPWTLSLFGAACFFWLRNEIAWFRLHPPPTVLEWAGRWSYSLYIMHLLVFDWLRPMPIFAVQQPFGWAAQIGAILAVSYAFYLVVEKPSHWLARRKQAPATGAASSGKSRLMANPALALALIALVGAASYVVWKKNWLAKYVLPRPVLTASVIPSELNLDPGQRLVFLGDSLTSAGVEPGGYVSLIEATLARYRAGLGLRIFGAGVGGNRVADVQARLGTVLALEPNLVCILIGINDVWHLPRTPPEQFEATLDEIVVRVQQRGATVLLCTPSAIGEQPDGSNPLDGPLDACAAAVRRVASSRQTMLCDLRKAFAAHRAGSASAAPPGLLTIDGVHLNLAGNRFVATEILRALARRPSALSSLEVTP